jgi:hypothetical protein
MTETSTSIIEFLEISLKYCETFRSEGHTSLTVGMHNHLLECYDKVIGKPQEQTKRSGE